VGKTSFVCDSVINQPPPSPPPRVTNDPLKISGSATSRWGIGYPESIELPCPGGVRLLRPRVVWSSFATVTIAYDAVGETETGRALVQVVKPRRLRWAPR
jgi:hypothetical protein